MSPSKQEQEFEALLEYLKRNRGFDFTGYKRASLVRRVQKRMMTADVSGFAEYVDYLEVHPEEFVALFNTILINVTSFFRDDSTWTYLADDVLPGMLARRAPNAHIRVWSAGCASGEEAYTLAMILAEVMGISPYKDRVKIYATDIDEEALMKGRHAIYDEREIAEIPEKLLKKYFEPVDGKYVFRKDMRRQVIFGRHDLITDAPISRVDLLVCRNTLMYLNAETQSKILARFHFALNDGGILFLGRAETLLTHANTFQPIDLKRRISTKVPRRDLDLRDRLMLIAQNGLDEPAAAATQHYRLREIAIDTAPVAQILVDSTGALVIANERARNVFGVGANDIGRAVQDLKISYRPIELRALIDQTQSDRRPVIVRDIEWQIASGEVRWFDLQLVPISDAGVPLGTSITFTDVSSARRLQRELEAARQDLEGAYEELQSTNEELETTNEELQSTIEELETTNEELQSTNEELETMNEELQSTNEELTTMNDEMRQRSDELNSVNAFFDTVLTSIRSGVLVVDPDLHVLVWNKRMQDMWGLHEKEVIGKNLLSLDMGLPVNDLKQLLKAVLAGSRDGAEMELPAMNRRGRSVVCRIAISRLRSRNDNAPRGAIVVVEDSDHGITPSVPLPAKQFAEK